MSAYARIQGEEDTLDDPFTKEVVVGPQHLPAKGTDME